MPTVQERLATIETKQDYIIKQLDLIITNHLPHIYTRLEQLEKCKAVDGSWIRFVKPVLISLISSALSVGLTYYFLKIC
ncbi:MAG: hypothetical protein ABSA75_02550 [Candidatus Bathyarchaeia archaeon]|jgi:hypothetical protein